ncbi:MAG TPA: PQQ-binding-like beta-propeller repeat protein, partial [Pirellulales bacterium]
MTLNRFLPAIGFALATTCVCLSGTRADDWPQWRGPHRDGVWHETGIVEKFADKELQPLWHAAVGPGYSAPTVADGRVYLTDRLEGKKGERIVCLDAKTGDTLWTHSYERRYSIDYSDGPRAAVTVDSGRAYSLGAMGDLNCLDAAKGDVVWKKDLLAEYKIRLPIWGITAAPLVEGNLLIVEIGGEEACIVAFNKLTGEEKWKALDDRTGYAAPIIIEQAGRRLLVCWTGDNIAALDPANGELLWKLPFKPTQMVLNVATPVVHDDRLFFTAFYDGSLMARLDRDKPAADVVWRRRGKSEQNTDALHSIISTPYFDGENVFGVDSYGELRCLDAKTGERIWESRDAVPRARWATIHFIKNGDRMFLFNDRGELIIAHLDRDGYHEISRTKIIEPTTGQLDDGRG